MTNTLHRCGSEESLRDEFIVFAIPSRGHNDEGCVPLLRQFLKRAVAFSPVNLGDASHGSIFRPNKRMTPLAHWNRTETSRIDEVIAGVDAPTTVAAVFDRRESAVAFIRDLQQADLGLSVNVSSVIRGAVECCREAGRVRHSVEYALPFMGDTDRLPEARVLEIATLCGHGMVSFGLVRKMIDWVKGGRRSPERAAEYLCRFCTCGIFNPRRAADILRDAGRGRA